MGDSEDEVEINPELARPTPVQQPKFKPKSTSLLDAMNDAVEETEGFGSVNDSPAPQIAMPTTTRAATTSAEEDTFGISYQPLKRSIQSNAAASGPAFPDEKVGSYLISSLPM